MTDSVEGVQYIFPKGLFEMSCLVLHLPESGKNLNLFGQDYFKIADQPTASYPPSKLLVTCYVSQGCSICIQYYILIIQRALATDGATRGTRTSTCRTSTALARQAQAELGWVDLVDL